MVLFNTQPVINILSDLARGNELKVEQIEEAIDDLERIKPTIVAEDDEAIDKVDEIQDYLQYLMTREELSNEEIKEEISDMVNDLRDWSK